MWVRGGERYFSGDFKSLCSTGAAGVENTFKMHLKCKILHRFEKKTIFMFLNSYH
jgi:hypothetical protein